MVGLNTDGPARDRVLKLMEEKDRIEDAIREQTIVLENNNIGMDESLVDEQGFPLSDIDVYKVRHARHQIICKLKLENFHFCYDTLRLCLGLMIQRNITFRDP